ncbi:hypothetical protein SAMN05660473_03928 [Arthrobacter sp. 49Tsu3.1M3]|uniref:hypothetical protein n=1 Tax=Arthrobacter sp. 49Tsu3.1M3 TaxID=1279029 RepID=UPI0009CFB47E|nr:hypothetical protein [Arthrobacter sp. 49Tsu3.1M3]SKC06943.1 hypothetical protein SAMN05660473_03928 [Arthrobacter sp. 49Tsu3.1M3]
MNNRDMALAITSVLRTGEALPVPLRALIAAILICERGGAPSRLGMSKVGGFSYGSSQKHYADFLTSLVEDLPAAVADMTSNTTDPVLAANLLSDLQERDSTIRDLRSELAVLSQRHEHLRRYALAMHERIRAIDAQAAVESGKKVSPLHPLL